jgi:hypothetical protein
MNINELLSDYRRIINKKYYVYEAVNIMKPFGININVMTSVCSLICDQPERLNPEDGKAVCDSPNLAEMQGDEQKCLIPM